MNLDELRTIFLVNFIRTVYTNYVSTFLQIYVSKKWGFSKWDRDVYEGMRADGRLRPDGANVQYMPEHGPLARWCKIQAELAGL